jgi:DNA-binding response OmpR family regulator
MLYHQLWESNWESETNVIEVHINRLRSKVDRGFTKALIHTIRGRGYMLSESPPQGAKFADQHSSDAESSIAS